SNAEVLGRLRTYARLPDSEALTYRAWIEAVRAGRTFVTVGPLLQVQVNGQDPGATINLSSVEPTVRVRAEAQSAVRFEQLELYHPGGRIVARAHGHPARAVIDEGVRIAGSGTVVAVCRAGQQDDTTLALTSAIKVQVDHQPPPPISGTLRNLAS